MRHRQTKGAATDMFGLQPLRHISTLPSADVSNLRTYVGFGVGSSRAITRSRCLSPEFPRPGILPPPPAQSSHLPRSVPALLTSLFGRAVCNR